MKRSIATNKLVSFIMASTMALSLFGCKKESDQTVPENTEQGSDGKVSIWLPISKTEYNADGSRGTYRYTYTYTNKGLPLTIARDQGGKEKFWNDDLGIYEYTLLPFDGAVDSTHEYFYNDHGDILYSTGTRNIYEDGELADTEISNYGVENQLEYQYDSNGNIESVIHYGIMVSTNTANKDVITAIDHHCYDDRGNLVEIYSENQSDGTITWQYDYRYDEEGRLTVSNRRTPAQCYQHQYKYDNGLLTEVTLLGGPFQAALDDSHVSQSSTTNPESKFWHDTTAKFSYDEAGRLISRVRYNSDGELTSSTECTYDKDSKLSTVIYKRLESDVSYDEIGTPNEMTDQHFKEEKYVYVDSDKDADSSATTLVRDKHGNVVKLIHPDGDYIVYEYQKFRMSEQDAVKCKNIHMMNHRMDPVGWINRYPGFGGGNGHIAYIPWIQTALIQTDIFITKF